MLDTHSPRNRKRRTRLSSQRYELNPSQLSDDTKRADAFTTIMPHHATREHCELLRTIMPHHATTLLQHYQLLRTLVDWVATRREDHKHRIGLFHINHSETPTPACVERA